MYLAHWKLKRAPFENVPDPLFFYYTAQHEEALSRLLFAAESKKGAAMLTGAAGCGKTTLSRAFIQKLPDSRYDISLVVNPNMSREDLLYEILHQFGVTPSNHSKARLLSHLNERVIQNLQKDRHTLIIVDEAHSITEESTYEELRLLLNFQLNDRFLLTLFLIGQEELRERVARIPQLAQRISIKAHLNPLDLAQTVNYIFFRLKKAGLEQNLFSKEALDLIFQSSGGIPRWINTICDLCLLDAANAKADFIDSAVVKKVIREI
ncbi:MAG: AAA family ATPase [Candidatus Tectomicrobia bacterium]|nr:AAA family ATPase [Candidatus Tectomicrobia bacterium]